MFIVFSPIDILLKIVKSVLFIVVYLRRLEVKINKG